MATQTEVLKVLSTKEAAATPSSIATELRAGEATIVTYLNRLKKKGYVDGDSREGWPITDSGRKALEAGGAQPSMTDQADIRGDLRRVWGNP